MYICVCKYIEFEAVNQLIWLKLIIASTHIYLCIHGKCCACKFGVVYYIKKITLNKFEMVWLHLKKRNNEIWIEIIRLKIESYNLDNSISYRWRSVLTKETW